MREEKAREKEGGIEGPGGEGGGGTQQEFGWGVRPTQPNPDPVQDILDVNFATLSTLSTESAVISYSPPPPPPSLVRDSQREKCMRNQRRR